MIRNYRGRFSGLKYRVLGVYLRIVTKQLFAVKILGFKVTSEKIFGNRLRFFDYNDFTTLFEEIFTHCDYLFETDSHKPVILDCGSNIGLSVIFFKLLYPEASVTAFEAHGPTYLLLKRNMEENKIEGVTIINRALHSKKGRKIWFYSSGEKPGALGMTVVAEKPGHDKKDAVITDVLSAYIKTKIDFIKMDIEGAEMEVLPEIFSKDRARFLNKMIVEYHHHVSPSQDKLGSILSMFEKKGFGYFITSWAKPPFTTGMGQDMLIFFYKK